MITHSQLNNLQKEILLDSKGRFVPYIGKNYLKGLGNKVKNNYKVLIIGPRHYCDAMYSSRNLLAYLTEQQRKQLKEGGSFPSDIKVGCVEITPEHCLRDRHASCPVYLNVSTKRCPLRKSCPIYSQCEFLKINDNTTICKGNRNLRCETLLAINDYLDIPLIESARLGTSYFDTITFFLNDEFELRYTRKELLNNKKAVWESVAFVNMIQRYIPLKGINSESNKIRVHIKEVDRLFCEQYIIKPLQPDIILLTMECVEKNLTTVLQKNNFECFNINASLNFSVFKRKSLNFEDIQSRWIKICERIWTNYKFPSSSIELGADIYSFIIVFAKNELVRSLSLKKMKNTLRATVIKILREREDVMTHTVPCMRTIKCFDPSLDYEQSAKISRKWLQNAHNNYKYKDKSVAKMESLIAKVIELEYKSK